MKKTCLALLAALLLAPAPARPAQSHDPAGSFTIRAGGGPVSFGGGDFNSGQRGWADFYGAVFGLLSYTPGGEVGPVRLGWDVSLEAVYRLSSSWGVGFEVDFVRGARKSNMTFTPSRAGLEILNYEAGTSLSALPLSVSLHYFLQTRRRIGFGARAGLGPAMAWGSASQRLSDETGDWTLSEYRVSGGGLSFRGGIGLEYRLGGRLALFVEARGRLASFSNFKGEATLSDSTGWSDESSGLLWNERVDLGSLGAFQIFEISESEPSGAGLSDVRRARVDFSGLSLVMGVVFKL